MEEVERTPVSERCHRVHWFGGRLHEVLDELTGAGAGAGAAGSGSGAGAGAGAGAGGALGGGVRVSMLSAAETAEALGELTTAQARIDRLRTALLCHAEVVEVAAEHAATSTGAWLAHATVSPPGAAHRLVRLARRLEAHPATADALGAGAVDTEQAAVIAEALAALPATVGAQDRARAEKHLLAEAAHHDARRLKQLAKHLLAVIDPDAAEAELARQVQREEAHAARTTMLSMFDDGRGSCHGTFQISSTHGAMLRAALDALASPKRPDPIPRETPDPEDNPAVRTTTELWGLAFQEMLERYPSTHLPRAGGGLATVLITISAADLDHHLRRTQPDHPDHPGHTADTGHGYAGHTADTGHPADTGHTGDTGVATLDSGGKISAGQLRRLACEAGIIPQVLGSRSEPLDQGRRTRLFTTAQHIAMRARDKTCTALGCTIPAAWCHAHHKKPWATGGRTDLADGRMLCPRHHTMIHHPRYTHTDLPNGTVQITKTRRRQ